MIEFDEKVKMYMKLEKEELAKLLAERDLCCKVYEIKESAANSCYVSNDSATTVTYTPCSYVETIGT